jgi:hypothetical protein
MKTIRNTSMQGLSIPFGTPEGIRSIFIAPKKQIEVPDTWKSSISENLVHRRMLKITHIADPTSVAPPPQPRKQNRKSN